MKTSFILLMLIALVSCNSFSRMKYGHIRKVPATETEFFVSDKYIKDKESDTAIAVRSDVADLPVIVDSVAAVIPQTPSNETPSVAVAKSEIRPSTEYGKQSVSVSSIKRDWSLFIGALFVVGGLLMLALCIFYYPIAGISFLWMIAFEIGTLYAAWRMIATGVTYFITRFRGRKNFSER